MGSYYTELAMMRDDYKSAHEKYLAFVEAAHRDGFEVDERLSSYSDTFALSWSEADVFRIEPKDVSVLFWAYERYENLIGSMDVYFGEFTEQERVDYAQFFRGELQWSFDLAVGFMVTVSGLSGAQCRGWVCKIVSSYVRGGLYDPA